MSDKSGIAWTDATWGPVTGCSKVSQGCKHCYAERDWGRLANNPKVKTYFGRSFTDVQCHPDRLDLPLRWQKPRRIFVNSMSDLFHEDVSDEFIDQVFAVMLLTPRHVFQVLTKRSERMVAYFSDAALYGRVLRAVNEWRHNHPKDRLDEIPIDDPTRRLPPHIWLGVSVENQETADERIPDLIQTPAAIRWISMEPLLGPVVLEDVPVAMNGPLRPYCQPHIDFPRLDWVVVGGESGPKARPLHADWVRDLRRECQEAAVPFFMKQLGAAFSDPENGIAGYGLTIPLDAAGCVTRRLRHRAGADMAEWPEDLRVREWPVNA